MTTTIHVINDLDKLTISILENNPDSHWLIFNGKDSEYYKSINTYAHDNMKKVSDDIMETFNGIFYSISKDAYIDTKYVTIDIEKYFEAIKCVSIPYQFKQVIYATFSTSDIEYIVSKWMTPKICEECVAKNIISEGFNIQNVALHYL